MDETHAPGAGATRAVCLKITRGGITGVLADARAARAAGADVYLASTFDGPRGIAAAVHVAAALRITRSCGLAHRRERSRLATASSTFRMTAGLANAPSSPCSVRAMAREWPETPDDPVDPALAPLIEAGEGESEGFELAEADLIEHAEHGDLHGDGPDHARRAGFDELLEEDFDGDDYAEADEEGDPDW